MQKGQHLPGQLSPAVKHSLHQVASCSAEAVGQLINCLVWQAEEGDKLGITRTSEPAEGTIPQLVVTMLSRANRQNPLASLPSRLSSARDSAGVRTSGFFYRAESKCARNSTLSSVQLKHLVRSWSHVTGCKLRSRLLRRFEPGHLLVHLHRHCPSLTGWQGQCKHRSRHLAT